MSVQEINYTGDLFQPKNVDERNLLYDRIADSFVGLFASIHKDVKDKFLSVCKWSLTCNWMSFIIQLRMLIINIKWILL